MTGGLSTVSPVAATASRPLLPTFRTLLCSQPRMVGVCAILPEHFAQLGPTTTGTPLANLLVAGAVVPAGLWILGLCSLFSVKN